MYSIVTPVMEVSVESGGYPLNIYQHGDYRLAGKPGSAYIIRVRNLTDSRIEVITSVDGRNTLEDEEAGFGSTGLVLHAHAAYPFAGWRLDNEGVREFLFGTAGDSVAAQAGDASNAGVIGIAAWKEKQFLPPERDPASYEWQPACRGARGMSASAVMDCNDMGTGIGAYKQDKVGTTTFERGDGPDIITIRYASREALKAAGIIQPDPFPAQPGYAKYRSPGQ